MKEKIKENYLKFIKSKQYSKKKILVDIIIRGIMIYRMEQLTLFHKMEAGMELINFQGEMKNDYLRENFSLRFYKIPEKIHQIIQHLQAEPAPDYAFDEKEEQLLHKNLNTFLVWFLKNENESHHYITPPKSLSSKGFIPWLKRRWC